VFTIFNLSCRRFTTTKNNSRTKVSWLKMNSVCREWFKVWPSLKCPNRSSSEVRSNVRKLFKRKIPGTSPVDSARPGDTLIKLFSVVNYKCAWLARVFVLGRPFHPSLMLVGKVRSLPMSGAPQRCFTRVGFGLTCIH